jgi:hypothetical protein
MNLDEKTANGIEPNDPANQAASLTQVTLKSPKPGNGGAKQRRPKNASDAMGGAAAKDRPAKSKSRKKALSFDDLAQATASIEAAAAATRANVVSISEVRSPAETAASETAAEADAAPAPAAMPETPVAEIAADLIPASTAEFAPEVQGDSMDAALDLPQSQLAPDLDDAPVAPMDAEPVAEEPLAQAPAFQPEIKIEPMMPATNGHGTPAQATESETKPAAEENAGGTRSRFEAIAARAVRAQVARSQPGTAVQAALAAQQQAAERTRQGNDFYSFWAQRKNGRRFPSYGDFDAKQIAELWPNTMLLSCGIIGAGNVNFTQVMRLTGTPATAESADEVNFTPMLTEWMLAIGREAASAGKPVQDIETFQNPGGASSYRIVALPLGNEETQVDHVLCNLARA